MRATAYLDGMSLWRRSVAEVCGTFWLVLGGCGSAVLAAAFPSLGIGFAGVALAFGLSVLTMAYALGPLSGGHFNPAVTVGPLDRRTISRPGCSRLHRRAGAGGAAGGPCPLRDRLGWAGLQPRPASLPMVTARTRRADTPPGSAALCELVLTCGFLLIIMGATDPAGRRAGFAPLAIGLALTLIHLISIPVTNTSVNPARSTGVALFRGWPGRSGSSGCSGWRRWWAARWAGSPTGRWSTRAARRFRTGVRARRRWSARRTSPRGRTESPRRSCSSLGR